MSIDPDRFEQNQPKRMGLWMVIAMWAIVLWLFTMFFTKWSEHEYNPNQNVSNVLTIEGVREVVLERNRRGHYVSSGFINDKPVTFMLDTGATDIAIPYRVAEQLGLRRGPTVYFQTANGPATGYATKLDSVAIGNIELENVRASINPNVKEMEILLGMSFLKHLEFTQRGDTLTLRQYPASR
ncbi:MAG: TIGR02281 family clan AA aspartic protease [Gammaproteobacteria bacterium]|jgi:aspartyl protease family protein